MLCEVKIRLTRPMLGKIRTKTVGGGSTGYVRRFARTRSKAIAIDEAHWIWAFRQAAVDMHLENVDTSRLHPSDGIPAPTLCYYEKRWQSHSEDSDDPQQKEGFESVRTGSVLTFRIALSDKPAADGAPPTLEQLEALLNHIGEFFGISQWGNKFGYGRFHVESISVL